MYTETNHVSSFIQKTMGKVDGNSNLYVHEKMGEESQEMLPCNVLNMLKKLMVKDIGDRLSHG